ncbi:aKG-HExxH-type peptide beta-hydroxylase [Nonomuraea sp. NPDC050556]|uniref:aKG-HExxH-type peptide beta-hydroxylase n=1 Tax=Nonomuraea sp. NPDC050556 TaxID=3364369 RepID=UPI0037AEC801
MTPDLLEIAAGRIRPEVVTPWRTAEFQRHLLLIETLRRKHPATEFAAAVEHLAETQLKDPDRLFDALSAPQVGVWAMRSLRSAPSLSDLHTLVAQPTGPLLSASCDGLVLQVELGHDLPHLDLFGTRDPDPDPGAWEHALRDGWRLVCAHDRDLAAAMAATLRVLVPLPREADGRMRGGTSGWAFGAIATSLPTDPMECAESLVHEFRHVLLGAVTNHHDLVSPGSTWKGRAPWRADPRPAEALLQGCYAYAGLIRLWRALNCDDALATWHEPTAQAVDVLAASDALTPMGQEFAAELRRSL